MLCTHTALIPLLHLSKTKVALWVFGEAHTNHHITMEGAVVGVYAPKIMDWDKDKIKNAADTKEALRISVETGDAILDIGLSLDMALCKGITKETKSACKNFVNNGIERIFH